MNSALKKMALFNRTKGPNGRFVLMFYHFCIRQDVVRGREHLLAKQNFKLDLSDHHTRT